MFCLFKLDGQIHETEGLVDITRSTTDIVFPDSVTFHDVEQDFKLHIELYCAPNPDYEPHNGHRMLRRTVSALASKRDKDDALSSPSGQNQIKYTIVGHAHLSLSDASDTAQTHQIKAGAVGASPSASCNSSSIPMTNQLSLWGQFCCLLRVQPDSATGTRITGFLNVQRMVGELPAWTRYWCVMRQNNIRCWVSPEDIGRKTAVYSIKISEAMQVVNAPRLTMRRPNTLLVKSTLSDEEHFISFESKEEKEAWHSAIIQCLLDQTTWKKWTNKVVPHSPVEPWKQSRGIAQGGQLRSVVISPAPKIHFNVIEKTSTASPLIPAKVKTKRHTACDEIQANHHDSQIDKHCESSHELNEEKENSNNTTCSYVEMAPVESPPEHKKRRAPQPPNVSPRPQPHLTANGSPTVNESTQQSTTPSAKKRRAPDTPRDKLPYNGETKETPTHLYTAM